MHLAVGLGREVAAGLDAAMLVEFMDLAMWILAVQALYSIS